MVFMNCKTFLPNAVTFQEWWIIVFPCFILKAKGKILEFLFMHLTIPQKDTFLFYGIIIFFKD